MSSMHLHRVAFVRTLASDPSVPNEFRNPRLSAIKQSGRREGDGTRYVEYSVGDAQVVGSVSVRKGGGYTVCIMRIDTVEFPHTAHYPYSWHHGWLTATPRRG